MAAYYCSAATTRRLLSREVFLSNVNIFAILLWQRHEHQSKKPVIQEDANDIGMNARNVFHFADMLCAFLETQASFVFLKNDKANIEIRFLYRSHIESSHS
jgi:hypothetical protein